MVCSGCHWYEQAWLGTVWRCQRRGTLWQVRVFTGPVVSGGVIFGSARKGPEGLGVVMRGTLRNDWERYGTGRKAGMMGSNGHRSGGLVCGKHWWCWLGQSVAWYGIEKRWENPPLLFYGHAHVTCANRGCGQVTARNLAPKNLHFPVITIFT